MSKWDNLIDSAVKHKTKIKAVSIMFCTVFVLAVVAFLVKEVKSDSDRLAQARREHEIASVTVGEVTVTNVLGLKVDSDVSGRAINLFCYGYGSLSSTDYYVVYAVQDDGGLLLTKYRCDETTVYPTLTDTEQPYYEETYSQTGKVMYRKLYIPESSMQVDYKLQ